MDGLPVYQVPGAPADAGFAHGRLVRDLLAPAFVEAYIERLRAVIRFSRDDLAAQSSRWLARLPAHYQEEIAGMGAGAGVPAALVAELLYADIARASDAAGGSEPDPAGPMCSAVISRLDDDATWIGRNCDWLVATLTRGTAAVVHAVPHRIPVMAVGIRGDIDVDTGINAERLWLHLHTFHAPDDPPRDKTRISWLFWAREALETCASLDDLERFVASTGRDRGVLAIAGDGKTNEAAIFECTRADHVRHDVDPARAACVTNHSPARIVDDDARAPTGHAGTVGRYRALRGRLQRGAPRRGPTDLIGLLASAGVEMRTPRWLRTIYSAVVCPRDGSLWFAAGGADGTPAASAGRWTRVEAPW